jgi:hypothetical protein
LVLALCDFIANSYFNEKIIDAALIIMFVLCTLQFSYTSIERYRSSLANEGYIGYLQPYDLETIATINEKYSSNESMLISDPLTMHIYEPLLSLRTPGGIFASDKISNMIWKYLNHKATKEEFLNAVGKDEVLLLFTGRTENWRLITEEQSFLYQQVVWTPRPALYSNCDYFSYLGDTKESNSVYCLFIVK